MRFTYNGHSYTFNNDILTDSLGNRIARLERANAQDEYNYYIDIESNEVMNSSHENEVLFNQDHFVLAGQYEAFND